MSVALVGVLVLGIVCLVAAAVGGGLKMNNVEFPSLTSVRRQVLLAIVGFAVIVLSLAVNANGPPTTSPTPSTPAPSGLALDAAPLDGLRSVLNSYDDCPDGRACVFTGFDGTSPDGTFGIAPGCGLVDLDSMRKAVVSVATHGNDVTLYDENRDEVGYVRPLINTNLALDEVRRAVTMEVHC